MLWLERHSGLVKVKDTLVYTCGVNMLSAERSCVRVIELIITGETKNMVERKRRHNVQGNNQTQIQEKHTLEEEEEWKMLCLSISHADGSDSDES